MLLRGITAGKQTLSQSAGYRLREVVRVGSTVTSTPSSASSTTEKAGGAVPMVGVPNAFGALLAQHAGLPLLYLSSSTLASSSLGLPDMGLVTLGELVEEARRITRVSALPLLVDADSLDRGSVLNVARAVHELEHVDVAGLHLADYQRHHHRRYREDPQPGVNKEITIDLIQAAVAARRDQGFVIMARLGIMPSAGLESALRRARAYVDAGADMLFPSLIVNDSNSPSITIDHLKEFTAAFPDTPIMAEIRHSSSGSTPGVDELRQGRVALALYPDTSFRAMAAAARSVLLAIARGEAPAPSSCLSRQQLRDVLDYEEYEHALQVLYPPPPARITSQETAQEMTDDAKETETETETGTENDEDKDVLVVVEDVKAEDETDDQQQSSDASSSITKEEDGNDEADEDEEDEEKVSINTESAADIEEKLAAGKEITLKG